MRLRGLFLSSSVFFYSLLAVLVLKFISYGITLNRGAALSVFYLIHFLHSDCALVYGVT